MWKSFRGRMSGGHLRPLAATRVAASGCHFQNQITRLLRAQCGFLRALFPLFLLIESTFLDAFPPLDLFARVHHHVGLSEIRSQFHPVLNQTGDKSPIYQTQPYVMLLAEYIPFYPIIYTRLHPQIYPNYITMKSIPHLGYHKLIPYIYRASHSIPFYPVYPTDHM